jgi:hypothetical protein
MFNISVLGLTNMNTNTGQLSVLKTRGRFMKEKTKRYSLIEGNHLSNLALSIDFIVISKFKLLIRLLKIQNN